MSHLAHLSTTDAESAFETAEVAVLAVGSTEQHGPHLPLGTDHLIADALANTTADRDDVIVLPMIPVGASRHHGHFHGTLSISSHTLERLLREMLESVADHGMDKIVVVNGHGGNTDAITRVAEDLRHDHTAYVTRWSWSDATADLKEELFGMVVGHADGAEASVMLHLQNELVHEERFDAAEEGGPDSETWGLSVHGGTLPFDTIDFTSTGATGYPTDASEEAGERIFETASEELHAHVDWLRGEDLDALWPEPHK